MIVDAPIIISGYLAPFFTEEDIQILLKMLILLLLFRLTDLRF